MVDNKFELDGAKQKNDHKLKIEQAEAKVLEDNLNEKVMRYNAMESAKKCLASKKFMCKTMKTADNDAVS